MTENEAIKVLVTQKQCIDKSSSGQCKINCGDCKKNIPIAYQEKSYEVAITALKEIQQYWEIGTVEECREAVEKQKPKKPRLNYKPKFFGKATYTCPRCGNCRLEEFANERQRNNYCWDCGQKLDWNENLEGMEDE
nr:MAG TPA: TFIIB zinc-binding [Caudoviricetes sp.]